MGSLQAQVKPVELANSRTFLTRLNQLEQNRKQDIRVFLAKHPGVTQKFTTPRGEYVFLHHIDAKGQPVYYQTRSNIGAATSIHTSRLWLGGGLGLDLQGQGMEVSSSRARLGMFEPGPARTSHQEFGGRATTRDTPLFSTSMVSTTLVEATDHATHVAGTMIATGVQPQARGMANQAKLDCYEIENDEYTEMQTAASEGMLVTNHSYGPKFDATRIKLGVYDESCQTYDNITHENKNYLQFHAAGNDRSDNTNITYDILIGGAVAKNVATIGAVKLLPGGYTGPASVEIGDFSSYGPTDDGRIKPDFVAPGVQIYSAYSGADNAYSTIDGTSMASPAAAGSLFLLQQHYRNLNGSFMRAASLKGVAIHTAEEAGTDPGPDYRFGWGLLNLEKAVQVLSNQGGTHLMEEATLTSGGTYRKLVRSQGGVIKVTICWTDAAGTPLVNGGINNRRAMLVNDLDVRVMEASTNQAIAQLPWKLDPANPSGAATRGDNLVDNIEQIYVDNLPAGQYYVQVTHKGTLQGGSQEFSVFASGLSGAPVVSGLTQATTCSGVASASQSLTIADGDVTSVTLSAASSNTTLVPAGNIILSGTGVSRSLVVTSVAGQSGTAVVTVTATNNTSATSSISFTLTVNALPTVSIGAAPSLTLTTGGTATLTASGASSYVWNTGATSATIGAGTGGIYSVTGTSETCSAMTSVTITGADLSPILILPQANFAATGSVGNFLVVVSEVASVPTTSGNVLVVITAPVGYTLSFNPSVSRMDISGGETNVAVDNTKWRVSSTLDNRQLSLIIQEGEFIGAKGNSSVGLSLTRTTATTGSVSNITVSVTDDGTKGYDGNSANNIYARIINGL